MVGAAAAVPTLLACAEMASPMGGEALVRVTSVPITISFAERLSLVTLIIIPHPPSQSLCRAQNTTGDCYASLFVSFSISAFCSASTRISDSYCALNLSSSAFFSLMRACISSCFRSRTSFSESTRLPRPMAFA